MIGNNKMTLAPIVLFVYNRPWHTKKTIESLQKNELASESKLYIYSDEAKNEDERKSVDEVRAYVESISGFKKIIIIKREKNWGLANSIIDGVTKVINEYGKIIVLEDDLITSPYFLKFMNDALEFYQDRKDIFSITGFSFSEKFMNFPKGYSEDIYLNIRPMSWSWASWNDRWDGIDWEVKNFHSFVTDKNKVKAFNAGGTDLSRMLTLQMQGKLDSWYIRWSYHAFLKKQLTIYPRMSFVNNLGFDHSGVHSGYDKQNIYSHSELNFDSDFRFAKQIQVNNRIVNNFNKSFNIKLKTEVKVLIKRIMRLWQ